MAREIPHVEDYEDETQWYAAYEAWREEYHIERNERIAALPVLDLNGPIDPELWLMHYAEDDNLIWRTAAGHLQNIIEYLIDKNNELQTKKGEQNA